MRAPHRRRGQGYVEFGVTIAVIVVVAMIGLDSMKVGVYAYFNGDQFSHAVAAPTPTPTGSGGGGPWNTVTAIDCGTLPPLLEIDVPYNCKALVRPALGVPPFHPAGTVTIQSDASTGGPVGNDSLVLSLGASPSASTTCTLSPDGPGSSCDFFYTPLYSGLAGPLTPTYTLRSHTLQATFTPLDATTAVPSVSPGFSNKIKRRVWVQQTGGCTFGDLTNPVVLGSGDFATCTVEAWDQDYKAAGSPPEEKISGQLVWTKAVVTELGNFNPPPGQCPLPSGSSACSPPVSYEPGAWGPGVPGAPGAHPLQVRFDPLGADINVHSSATLANGPLAISVADQTTTTITGCTGSASYSPGMSLTCTVDVTDTTTGSRSPTGTVAWSVTGPGGSFGTSPATCYLTPTASPDTSRCTINYQPTSAGDHSFTATYNTPYTTTTNGFWPSNDNGILHLSP